MGDSRFDRHLDKLREASDRVAALKSLADDEVVQALAAASRESDPYFANVLATETLNRLSTKTSIVENAAQGLIATERNGEITYANPAAEAMLGVGAGGLNGARFPEMLGHARETLPSTILDAEFGVGLPLRHVDDELVRPDGTIVPVDWAISADVRDGEARGFVIALTNVSERRVAAARLERERLVTDLLLAAQSNLGEAVILSNGRRILHVNEACILLTGRAREELLGLSGLRDIVAPNDITRLAQLGPSGAARRRFDIDILQPSGRRLCVEAAIKTLEVGDDSVTVTLLRDVTTSRFVFEGLRESERAFRAAFERAPIGLAQLALDGSWRRLNEAAARALGHTVGALHHRPALDIIEPEDWPGFKKRFGLAASGAETVEATRVGIRKSDGRSAVVSIALWGVRDDEGDVAFVDASIAPGANAPGEGSETRAEA